jgi:PDZ domain-containing protein
VDRALSFVIVAVLAVGCFSQTTQTLSPADPGMYVENGRTQTKIIGQIAEFKRTGSLLVSKVTVGIKSRKQNIQLLGAHAQTAVSAQPAFYFIPAKQEAEAGVNAGDLILMRLEEKSTRRQFEVAAAGLWRASSGISLAHQIQLIRSEEQPGVYKLMPTRELEQGEYALYLSRGEGMAAYVYDFSVQGRALVQSAPSPTQRDVRVSYPPQFNIDGRALVSGAETRPQTFSNSSIGVFCEGNADVHHDGVVLTALTPGGPADQVGIKSGDFILAIDDHFLFTIRELKDEVSRHPPGTRIRVRYRRYSAISEATLVVGQVD